MKKIKSLRNSPFYIAPVDLTPTPGPKRLAKMKAEVKS